MKPLLLISLLIIAALSITSCGTRGQQAEEATAAEAVTEDVHLHYVQIAVTGMTCEGCENTVKGAIEKVAGVHSASATHADAYALAGYAAGAPDTAALRQAIAGAGYTVTGMKFIGHDLPKKE
ncbi:MAG: heavy-metal-associated domain-containing protein [Bacteroidetes bacterium]|nr:heavy-metal-associated domain-containing protein [Bacteroidota bacterium]